MNVGDTVGFGLYTERALLAIRDLVDVFMSTGQRTYRTYEAVRALEFMRFPDGEVGVRLNFTVHTPFGGNAGPDSVKAWTARVIRRLLATPCMRGVDIVGRKIGTTRREAVFLASAITGTRRRHRADLDGWTGSKRDEVETELYRQAEAETGSIRASAEDRIAEVKRRIDRGKDAVYAEFKKNIDAAFERYCSEKNHFRLRQEKSNRRLHARFKAAVAGIRRKAAEDSRVVYAKYGIEPPAANSDGLLEL